MKLTFDKICQITTGAVSIQQSSDGIHFYRFTPTQAATYGSQDPYFLERALSTTGCTLDMITDADHIALDITSGNKFEIYVDMLPVAFFNLSGPQVISCPLPAGKKRVTVTLPSHVAGVIRSVELSDGASVEPCVHDLRVLFLGDSITQGWDSLRDSYSYTYIVTRHLNAEALNYGLGGSRFSAQTLEDVGFDADIVFISYGTNDYTFYPSMEVLKNECAAYLDAVRSLYPHSKVFCISPIWRDGGERRLATGTLDECRAVIIEEAAKRGFVHIDGYSLVPHMNEYYTDGLHPNDLGFALYGQNLVRQIQPFL